MARRTLIRCLCCGTPAKPEKFGFDLDGEPLAPTSYLIALAINDVGGRGMCTWHNEPLPMPLAKALLASMKAAVARLEDEIETAEVSSGESEAA